MKMIALTTALALTACSSQYMPQSRGRVAVTMRGGQQAYVRDGKVYEHGVLGGGLVEAVQGNPSAMVAANEYHDRMTYGLLGMLGGLGAMLGGTIYAASQIDPYDETSSNKEERAAKIGLTIALAGTIITCIGAAYLATAEPYRWDAINMFNDAPPPLIVPPGPPGPGWSASTTPAASLKMRDE